MIDIAAVYEKHTDKEFLKFDRVTDRQSERPDLHAFLLLDKLVPGTRDIVTAAEHDEIWLDVNIDELSVALTEEQMIELIRCGVRYDKSTDSLAMFV